MGNLKEAIQTITIIVDRYKAPIADNDKMVLIRCLKYRLQANFQDENYKENQQNEQLQIQEFVKAKKLKQKKMHICVHSEYGVLGLYAIM
ncbi:unnamed protein product [Rotaria sp. Silwood1]|nr:unnamed protein product [Rotaria sp. Silwood1]